MAVSAQDVKKLRDMTGAGMMDCKEALTETGGDFDAAVDMLRKKGLSKAAKKAGRETNEGVVAAFIRPDGSAGSLVEVNCETDFVARTEDFTTFVKDAIAMIDAKGPGAAAELLEQPWVKDPAKSVQNVLAELIGKLGENMQLSRVAHFKAPAGSVVHSYIHPGARVGVLIEAVGPKGKPEFDQLVHDLAMQVAAAQARFVRREEVDGATVEHEKGIYREQLKESGKPAQVIEKIVEGKLNSYYGEVCLLEQPFIKDPNTKVQDLVAKVAKDTGAPVTVTRFARFALGEGL